MVDHWDGCDRNHRWNNLRAATASLNGANTVQRSSATGHRGVYPNNRAGTVPTYRATIRVRGRMIELGTYKTLEEAVARRLAAEEEYQGEFAASHRPVGGLTTPD